MHISLNVNINIYAKHIGYNSKLLKSSYESTKALSKSFDPYKPYKKLYISMYIFYI